MFIYFDRFLKKFMHFFFFFLVILNIFIIGLLYVFSGSRAVLFSYVKALLKFWLEMEFMPLL